jgi:hypothetical protein
MIRFNNVGSYFKYARARIFYFLYCTYSFTECKIKNNSDYRITFKGPGYSASTANTIDKCYIEGYIGSFPAVSKPTLTPPSPL